VGEVLRNSSLGQCLLAEGGCDEVSSRSPVLEPEDEGGVLEQLQRFAHGHLELGEEGRPARLRGHQPHHHLKDVESPPRVLGAGLPGREHLHHLGGQLRTWDAAEPLELGLRRSLLCGFLRASTEEWHRGGI
jgi:hypothetical protein